LSTEPRIKVGTVAFVTGASSGIGRAIAVALVREGCRVVLAGRNQEALWSFASSLGEEAHPLVLDVTIGSSVDKIPNCLPEKFRDIGILINNAGHDVGGRTRFDQGPVDDWTNVIETNVSGLIRITRAVAPGMVTRGTGDIVNIGSISALRIVPDMAAYSASKAAVHAFSDVLRADFAETAIRVTEILPGLTRTEIVLKRVRGDKARAEEYYKSFKMALEPEDVAAAVLFALRQPAHVMIAQLIILPTNRY
jgi:3-hydroxy acid dehydrogenase/malonic semialdehyde reductase